MNLNQYLNFLFYYQIIGRFFEYYLNINCINNLCTLLQNKF